jgi:hypothetical protein
VAKKKRTYLKEIGVDIRKSDIRTIKNWCKLEGLQLYKDVSGTFVLEEEYLNIYNNPEPINKPGCAVTKRKLEEGYSPKGSHSKNLQKELFNL